MIRRKRAAHGLFAVSFLVTALAVFGPASPTSAESAEGGGGFTGSVRATRVFIDKDGNQTEASTNDVNLTVGQTKELRGRQEVHVTWSGAIPTRAVVGDPNSSEGRNQEYPFVLLQCRGVDAAADAVPSGQSQLTPETCWTQTAPERYLSAASHTPPWRFDAFADAEDRKAVVGAPDPLPDKCKTIPQALTARWLPLRGAGGEVYLGGPDPASGCVGLAPESDSAESGGLPSNTTYGATGTDGTGEADFAVWTAAENATLGCSATVACSLVAVPIVGTSCDAWGTELPAGTVQTTKAGVPLTDAQLTTADEDCRRAGSYCPGSRAPSRPPTPRCAAACGGRPPTGATGSRSRSPSPPPARCATRSARRRRRSSWDRS